MKAIRALFSTASRAPTAPQDPEENPDRYCPGGYHSVYIGEIFNDRYKVLCKLGYGLYSTVWLARDIQSVLHSSSGQFAHCMKCRCQKAHCIEDSNCRFLWGSATCTYTSWKFYGISELLILATLGITMWLIYMMTSFMKDAMVNISAWFSTSWEKVSFPFVDDIRGDNYRLL